MNCFYLNTFYSVLTFSYFYTITNFYSHSHHCYDYFCYYCFCHCHCHYYFFIFNAFNFYFSSFYYCILSLYISDIFKFQTNDVAKHCSKLTIKTLRLYQCLWWKHCLLNLFFWRSSFEVTLLYFTLDNYSFYSVSIFGFRFIVAELPVFSCVIWLHIAKASEKKRYIWDIKHG